VGRPVKCRRRRHYGLQLPLAPTGLSLDPGAVNLILRLTKQQHHDSLGPGRRACHAAGACRRGPGAHSGGSGPPGLLSLGVSEPGSADVAGIMMSNTQPEKELCHELKTQR